MTIDKAYYRPDPQCYFRDLLIPMAAFVAAFAWCLNASGGLIAIPFAICVVSIHRAGVFGHEISHRYDNPRLKTFNRFWDLTVGAVILLPSVRFVRPHRIHHAPGTFRTRRDPQYLMMRRDWKQYVLVVFLLPFIMPAFNLALVVGASFGTAFERSLEGVLQRWGLSADSGLSERRQREASWLARYYLVVFCSYAVLLPETLPLMYAIQVGGWLLTTLRIPLEHAMEERVEKSDKRDQVLDSFTVESPLAALLQPLALRYHTAHHMYPGVPYHNLAALHEELKARDSDYRNSIVSLWAAFRDPAHRQRAARAEAH